MVKSARSTLIQFRRDPHHHMTPAEFKAHMLRNYESAVVSAVYVEFSPHLAFKCERRSL